MKIYTNNERISLLKATIKSLKKEKYSQEIVEEYERQLKELEKKTPDDFITMQKLISKPVAEEKNQTNIKPLIEESLK